MAIHTPGTKSKKSSGTIHTPRGVNQGTVLVDPRTGHPIDIIEDGNGIRRLAVDANFTLANVSIDVDLDGTDPNGDTVALVDPDTGDRLQIESDGSINVNCSIDAEDGDNIAISAHPASDQIFQETSDTLTTNGYEEIFSYTSASNATRIIEVECTAETASTFRLKINGVIKKVKRSSPLERNIIFEFKEHRPLNNGIAISVEARVDRKIFSSYSTFTSLEGYIV
jgi:hypothetical protein